jgi:autotransporter-associated beta strand protein
VSGSGPTDITSLNAFTQSQDTKNSTLATYTGSVDTKFVAVGSSTSSLNSATASLFTSASLALVTASLSGNTITFTKGDTTTFGFQIPDVSGSTIPAGTISGSSQITALGFVSSSVTGSSLVTGSVSGNVLTFTKGDATTFTLTVATGSGGSTFSNPSVESISGSLLLTANTFNSGSANLLHITASAQNQSNLVFKNNNTTGDTIISGSNNIFTNPAAVTTGYKRYIGGSNNLYLNNTNGINSQITASATSVSGTRPSMVNNIFAGTGNFSINQAPNPGTHTYGQNIIGGTGNTTINALGFTGSLNFNSNFNNNGTITINAASASNNEITGGLSGSGTFTMNSNGIFGGTMTLTSPRILLTGNTQTANNNLLAGSALTVTNISSSAAVNASNNISNGGMSYTNAGASAIHTSAGAINTSYGALTVNAIGSAVSIGNNLTLGGATITNNSFTGSAGAGQISSNRNLYQGQGQVLTITGSADAGASHGNFSDNTILGRNVTIFSNQTGAGNYNSFNGNVIGGQNLIVTASNNFIASEGGGAHFGRWNANDGRRNRTGETVFSVGTGTSTTGKTGFLIDSGSNTFVEGTLNVSGSSSFTGSILVNKGALQVANYTEPSPQFYGPTVFQGVGTASVAYDHFVNAGNYDALHIESNLNAGTIFQDYDGGGLNTWLTIPTNTGSNPKPIFSRGLDISGSTSLTGSLTISSTLTASLQNGYVWVGNGSGITTTVATSSFAGGSSFPYTGNAVITGSLGISGSMFGGVIPLSVVSLTASIDMSAGNFFTLSLPTGSTTHITATNLRAGQAINLQVSQSLSATGSVAFSPIIKFAGGYDYTATAITGALDLVSFATFDTNQLLATAVKNLL